MTTQKSSLRILSSILAVILTLSLSLCSAAAQSDDNILISSAEQLISLAYSTAKSDFSKNYRLTCDIDMSQTDDVRPIKAIGSYSGGSNDIAFNGTFDGDGHKIINLSATAEALFGYVGKDGVIKNLTLQNASVHYRENSSSKYPAALVSLNYGEIYNCFSVKSSVVSDYCSPAGGLVGTNFGTISHCGVSGGNVSFAVSKIGTSHGGFVGNQRSGIIEECFSTAAVDAKKWAGGFAGKIEDGIISDCYAAGYVNGTDENGGFAGALMNSAVVKNSYSAVSVNAASGGGFAGGKGFSFAEAGEAENCYYLSDSSLPQSTDSFENNTAWAKSADEMRTAEFAALLSDKWAQDSGINNGYPYLINNVPPEADSETETVTAQIMIAGYDSTDHKFYKTAEPCEVTLQKNTPTVKDAMEAAAENGSLTYSFGTNEQSGQIVTINNISPKSPEGWMFAVNGSIASVGAASAIITDEDILLWFVGSPSNGYIPPVWEDTDPADSDFISINTASELAELSQNPDRWDGNYKLSDNIDLTEVSFSPIGTAETPFSGSFDGNGFDISNLTLEYGSDSQNIGLFGVICGANLKNISLHSVKISGGSIVGSLVGRAMSDSDAKSISLITNCHADGTVAASGTSYAKQTDAGGLVGINDSAENTLSGEVFSSVIDNCTADVEVTGDTGSVDISEAGHIGGLAGLNKGIISNSSATGDVRGGNTTGGFVGSNYGGSIYSSSAKGAVSGAYSTGGFAGSSGLYSLTENSYSTGDVTALGENGANFGGFAGSVSGKLKNCISSGTLTPGWSYNGGFIGTFSGTVWSYNDELRSLNGCFGNCTANSGDTLKALGNYIGGVHIPTDTAANEIGVDKATAERKIAELTAALSADTKLRLEAAKYRTAAVIPSTVNENSDITALVARLNPNTAADGDITLSYKSGDDIISASSDGYVLNSRPETDLEETVTLSLSLDGAEYEQAVNVTLLSAGKQTDKDKLLENIAEEFARDSSDYWKIVVAAMYDKAYGKQTISDDVKNAFVKNAVNSITESGTDTTLAMDIIVLRSLGYDPTNIITADGTRINAAEKLAASPSTGNNGDAYRLLAYKVCGYNNPNEINKVTERLLGAQIDKKGWSNNDDDGIDPDSTGAVLLGLSPYLDDSRVKTAADNAVSYLSSLIQTDGNIKSSYKENNYGTNANTSAICAIALEAMGIDIKSDERFTNNLASLYDGIMAFAADDERGFVYEYSSSAVNPLATAQAALAVMSADKNVSITDFANMPSNAIKLLSDVSAVAPSGRPVSGTSLPTVTKPDTKTITVYFTLIGDTPHGNDKHSGFETWISDFKIQLPENTSADKAAEKALSSNGYGVKGLEKGYITEITTPGSITLGEYSNGSKSGWMYSVNEEAPSVGISDYILKNGDKLKVYYSDSWETSPFTDVTPEDGFFEAAQYAFENGLVLGNEYGAFMPAEALTRAMAVTILGRMDGVSDTAESESTFTDVDRNEWYGAYVIWAADNGIVMGIGNGMFAPDDSITREQLAAILYRYSKFKGMADTENSADLGMFSDSGSISDWAAEPMAWAAGAGLIHGYGEGIAAPLGIATREQFVLMLMRLSSLTK